MKALIVDDDPDVVNFLTQVAAAFGDVEVESANSAEEALTMVIRSNYDLITLDIVMPGASGLEILSMVRDLCPHAVVAIVSAHVPEEISDELAGCADVILTKPVPLETIHRVLAGAARVSEAVQDIRILGDLPTSVRMGVEG
jgi:CheY-like chemotaxis protein